MFHLKRFRPTLFIAVATFCSGILIPINSYAVWSDEESSDESDSEESRSPVIAAPSGSSSSPSSYRPYLSEKSTIDDAIEKSKTIRSCYDRGLATTPEDIADFWKEVITRFPFDSQFIDEKKEVHKILKEGVKTYRGKKFDAFLKCYELLPPKSLDAEDHRYVATLYTNFAKTSIGIDTETKRKEYYKKAIQIWEVLIRGGYGTLAEDYRTAANCCYYFNKDKRAAELITIALSMFENQSPPHKTTWDPSSYEYDHQLKKDRELAFRIYFFAKEWAKTTQTWERMGKKANYDSNDYRKAAKAYFALKKYQEAAEWSEKALGLEFQHISYHPKTTKSFYAADLARTAHTQRRAGNYERAEELWDKFYALDRDDDRGETNEQRLENLREAAEVYYHNGKYKEAARKWQDAYEKAYEKKDTAMWDDRLKAAQAWFKCSNLFDCDNGRVICEGFINGTIENKEIYIPNEAGKYVTETIKLPGLTPELQERAKKLLEANPSKLWKDDKSGSSNMSSSTKKNGLFSKCWRKK
ncbi:MAG: hypothetical protein ACD_16C00100G0060 [uncultured bacterium]|nr:MAG: hypothetical protein ACD_16C00100G0060 [uncultured bacterium]OFW68073.1 MAG: hypothetical protein A2X70_05145 [Alphaproteobacteria bacterium GWC2_42_16]OFW73463.1 MAG: hypothetical protein A2Z80_06445 [Alphaproteobacteria bacterium GWA2_41_27]OFW82313.1 MAG: hypothetical protein A3E50_03845 [Alphaproteobacteria bacterium RIFCSPHIGHO2_12_FULL_42_100]OFW86139.1 MAG: hypothetical protein A2W06_00775 [Alphaproteobacteria bacterium RBG_16_42_14]OFW91699.1 MAG: hypothetical protein A3C41_008